ncbi:MAG: two-component sensor histidine kinase [Myxococcales bacterium]|nr:MAG: two-component sensor histidine kinase [Myxococcales bacterium]
MTRPPAPPSRAQRLAWLLALRLVLLLMILSLTGVLHLRERALFGVFSGQLVLGVLAIAFAAAAWQAVLLRRGRFLGVVAVSQILVDQVTWTLLAYVSGGVASGITAFYGLTCLMAAVVEGVRGVVTAAVAALVLLSLLCAGFVSGALGPPPDQGPERYLVSWHELSFPFSQAVLALTLAALLAGYLAERLRQTGGLLAEAQQRAAHAEHLALLGRFAAGLAHEIRNPLGAIAGSVDLLASTPALNDDDRVLCTIISRETARLNDLVSDMLELAKPRVPSKAPVDLVSVASDVVRLAAHSGRGSDVPVVFEPPHVPLLIEADASQLRQVLWNLVRNAVQASGAGCSVTVRVRPVDHGAVLEVSDQGKGISEETRSQLFDAFFTTRTQGIGIGLAVVKRVVDDHGWSIEVDSQPGHGATFRVVVPRLSGSSG